MGDVIQELRPWCAEMARDISVYRAEDIEERPDADWRVREGAVWLFDAPRGSESAVCHWWSLPTALLKLPLLASIYEVGFHHGIRWSGPQLKQVLDELDRLEEDRAASNEQPDTEYNFAERVQCMRQAIAIAESCDGAVVIV